ncbi:MULTISPECIES: DMT family transporter [unclassified Massilia]|uniref:DMT family transporter n=1 Tax=unclassified Massilia TaxID=2609279 RepID=UPI001782E657|nr:MULTISPECIES: DMT family transporter [unclassified Massilia]MBD8532333.1 EamA family transporter [Massilia sp. CFBP 13647]MBD8673794.1 EamA family transporter [Massilia sp. CFBP 13721]
MRGCAPLLVALVGALGGEVLGASQWLAVGLICGGVLAMVGGGHSGSRRTTLLALGTAGVIALYTLIDGAGVRRSGAPAGYTMWIFVLTAVGVLALGWRRHGRGLLPFARRHLGVALGGGLMTAGSYGIALWAMTAAPMAAVAALRETAILFATLIAALLLRERVGPARVIGAVLIACGAAAMRLT